MQVIAPNVNSTTFNIPLVRYKSHSTDIMEIISVESQENFNLRDKIVIDRRWAQRLVDSWKDEKSSDYILDIYNGFNNIDAIVLIKLSEIVRLVENHIEQTVDNDNKSTFNSMLIDMKSYMDNGKEYLMINGQHRDDVFHRLWDSKFELPEILEGMDNSKLWCDLDSETQIDLLTKLKHPITIYDKMSSLDDIEKIIILHNEGSEWNAHEKRSIKASYLMSELVKLDDYTPAKKLFELLGTSGTSYDLKKKGISFSATQLYYQYKFSKDKYNVIEGINSKTLDNLAEWESKLWTKNSVDAFITFFKKIIRELSTYFIPLSKNHTKVIRHTIPTLRNYFMLRQIMSGRTNFSNFDKSVYKVTNEHHFMTWFVRRECERLLLINNLSPEGVKLHDSYKKSQKSITPKQEKSLYNDYPKSNPYRLLLNGSSEAGQKKIAEIMFNDFKEQFESGKLNTCVQLKGLEVSQQTKTEVRRLAIANLDSFEISDIHDLQNTDTTDVGHKDTPKSKGGSNFGDNLFIQDQDWNRSEQDNH